MNWFFSKRYDVRCPDGSTKTVFKKLDHAFPLYIPGLNAKVAAELKGWEQLKGSLKTEFADRIQGLIFRIDELNQGLMIDFRAVYMTYVADPCANSAYLVREVERTLTEQRRLREFKLKVQTLITLAESKRDTSAFLPIYLDLIHALGGPPEAEAEAAAVEIAANRDLAQRWAGQDQP